MSSPKTTPPKSTSSSQSSPPPRKRFRSDSSDTAMIGEQSNPSSSNSPEQQQPARSRTSNNNTNIKMKMKGRRHSSGLHQGGSGSSQQQQQQELRSFDEEDEGDFEGEYPIQGASSLLRMIPKKSGLNKTDLEVVRLIGQHLTNIGLKASVDVLMHEAGVKLDQPSAASFKNHVMSGHWGEAVKALEDLKDHLECPKNFLEMKFLLFEQKYLEFLAQKNRIEALRVLQTELTPLQHNQARTHQLSSFLMLSKPEDINKVTRSAKNSVLSRCELMDRLQTFLPPSIMLPPRRLHVLMNQAAKYQTSLCLYHNKSSPIDIDSSYLATDHQCSKDSFPCETMQILTDHNEEVWYCKFSPNGLFLASGSKDMTVIIWEFDPETLSLKHYRTLERHSHGVSFFAWSPDSQRIAVCGPEDCDEVIVWNVERREIEIKISHSAEDSLTVCAWSPCGKKIACGGNRGNFYQCDMKGTVNDSWEGVRIQGMQYHKDGKQILAADTHHRIRSYNFEDLRDNPVLHEDHGIMSFTLDNTGRYALLSIANQGLHLWDIVDKCLVRKYKGITQGFYTIYSCFGGGPSQKFVASGSEDTKVYVYHIKREEPIHVLDGHTRTVNCVDWNPVYNKVLVSASDDGTIRVWGPNIRYRQASAASTSSSSVSNTSPISNGSLENGVSNGATSNGVS